ncbi:AAA family ATPase [Desulfosediminicola flagellatus]|uniref:AAA family ATPase n=1 Tax=Desulfosediminicola flagellatus TaxID=2569541 RepID=UPI0010ACAECA|nr:AAA family ATPase [Desulfosediminicola flagellatus]
MPKSQIKTLQPEVLAAYHKKRFQTPVIGVTGGKGGVGKTTVAVNIACALANFGHKVALVDADVDAPNAAILMGMRLDDPVDIFITVPYVDPILCTRCGACIEACRLNSLFLPQNKPPVLLGACNGCEACLLVCEPNAIRRGKRTIGTTYKTTQGNVAVYTGELIPSLEESAIVVDRLKVRVFQEAADFDLIIVDTSPGAHCNVIKALQGADMVIAVTEPTPLGAHDFGLILELLDILKLKCTAFLNRADLPSSKKFEQDMTDTHNIVFETKLNCDDLLIKSYVHGKPFVTLFPEAAGAMTFIRLAQHIAHENLP